MDGIQKLWYNFARESNGNRFVFVTFFFSPPPLLFSPEDNYEIIIVGVRLSRLITCLFPSVFPKIYGLATRDDQHNKQSNERLRRLRIEFLGRESYESLSTATVSYSRRDDSGNEDWIRKSVSTTGREKEKETERERERLFLGNVWWREYVGIRWSDISTMKTDRPFSSQQATVSRRATRYTANNVTRSTIGPSGVTSASTNP